MSCKVVMMYKKIPVVAGIFVVRLGNYEGFA